MKRSARSRAGKTGRVAGFTSQIVASHFDREGTRQALKSPFAHPTIDTVVAADDEWAVVALLAHWAAVLGVPEEVTLTGFDDQLVAEMLHPEHSHLS